MTGRGGKIVLKMRISGSQTGLFSLQLARSSLSDRSDFTSFLCNAVDGLASSASKIYSRSCTARRFIPIVPFRSESGHLRS